MLNNEIKIIENFANFEEQESLKLLIKDDDSHGFDVSSVDKHVIDQYRTEFTIDYPQFVKVIFQTSDNLIIDNKFFPLVYYLLHKNKLSNKFIYRIKMNTTFPYPNAIKENHGPIHDDIHFSKSECFSIIYYVNENDGDTLFFNDNLQLIKKVKPKQGRAVIFDSKLKHAASCPINYPYRQIINFVIFK